MPRIPDLDTLLERAIGGIAGGVKTVATTYFDDFRVAEFTAYVGASYLSMTQLGAQLQVPSDRAHHLGLVGAAFAAFCYIRNPKKKGWAEALPAVTTPPPVTEEETPI